MNYRIQFNEKQQQLHLDNYSTLKDSHGWVTIIDSCSELEYWQFLSFLEALYAKPYTKKQVYHALGLFYAFLAKLTKHRMTITICEIDDTPASLSEFIEMQPQVYIQDGFGNKWSKQCKQCGFNSMYVVRPGKASCRHCESTHTSVSDGSTEAP